MVGLGAQAWIATAINMPHFMASYRMVYRSPQMMWRHQWASIYVPILMLLYVAVAIWQAQYSPAMVTIFIAVSSGYLAWHYTGQVWGMMASFAHLEGVHFEPAERLLIRGSLRILLAWHVTWFVHTSGLAGEFGIPTDVLYRVMTGMTLVALVLGAVGIQRLRRRTGRWPPVRALVAWAAIFVWYAAMARDPKAIFWVQIAHALQYLEFPVRVEISRTARAHPGERTRVLLHMGGYAVLLLAVSYVAAMVLPGTAMSVIGDALGERPGQVAPILILSFINIHHYFTDGVMWKLRNPAVRQDLFAHVVQDEAPVPAGPAKPRRGRRP